MLNYRTHTIARVSTSNVNGVIKETLASSFTVSGNLQPMNAADLSNAPEGFRNMPGRKWKLYTGPTVELESNDRLIRGNADLFVQGLMPWDQGIIPHKKWMLTEQTEDSDA